MDDQLQRLIELQTEQNQLLKRYLWRFRFSLLTLLVLTTAICCTLGFIIYKQQVAQGAAFSPLPVTVWSGSVAPGTFSSGGTLTLNGGGISRPAPAPAPTTKASGGAVWGMPEGSSVISGQRSQ
jgi:hypothetical protein